MHKVYLKGVRSLEDKFDKEHADWIEENVATVRFDKIPFEDAAKYNKKEVVIMTVSEYEALTSGNNLMIPSSFVMKLITLDEALETVRAILEDMKDSTKESAEEGKGEK